MDIPAPLVLAGVQSERRLPLLSSSDLVRRALVHLALNLNHYAAAVWGLGLRFDPAVIEPDFRATWPAIETWLGAMAWGFCFAGKLFAIGAIVFWISPIWAIAASGLGDPLFEYRGYGAHLGLAMMLAAVLPPGVIWVLVAVWAAESFYRARHFRTALGFWRQVIVENHGYGQRGQAEYARALIHRREM
jgi:hypothetical protein